MAVFSEGDAVIVAGRGPGVVTVVMGGPAGKLYRVTLTDPESQLYGISTSYTTDETDLTAAADLPTYAPGDKVMYQSRMAEVVAVDPVSGAVEIVAEPTLPDPEPEVNIESRIVLERWELYLQQAKV
jgi:hypothetical protein